MHERHAQRMRATGSQLSQARDTTTQQLLQPFRYAFKSNHPTLQIIPSTTLFNVVLIDEKLCTELSHLSEVVMLDSPDLTDDSFRFLSYSKTLTKVKVCANRNITDTSIKFIAKNCTNLAYVSIIDCEKIGDQSLKFLAGLKNLTVLNLADCIRLETLLFFIYLVRLSSIIYLSRLFYYDTKESATWASNTCRKATAPPSYASSTSPIASELAT